MNIAVLGVGMVGRAIALDLAGEHKVTAFDWNTSQLNALHNTNPAITITCTDLSQFDKYPAWLSPFELVVTAVPGYMGFHTLQAVIHAGKNVVDISFFSENALLLDALAKEKNVTVITDCGLAPGMSNFIVGRYNDEMKINSFTCYVGGLPKNPQPPFFYKAPFSPVDVIEEYIRPARLMENGHVVSKPPLSDRELLNFGKAGVLEAFNTDGLRSLIYTMAHIPDMKEKTLRHPKHIDIIIALQEAGFFSRQSIELNGVSVIPLDFTSKLLIDAWKPGEEEEEFTVMKVIIKGENKTITYELYDEYDPISKTSSMARTTGYTCAAAVNLIANGLFSEKGVFPPERVGKHKACFDFVLQYLVQRNVNWIQSIQ